MDGTTVLAAGHVTHDRFRDKILPGGCAYYAARTWQALEAISRLATAVGTDFVCEDAFGGLETRVVREGKTTVFTNLYPDSGPRVQYVEALAPPVTPGQLPGEWTRPDVLFLGPVLDEVDMVAFKQATAAGLLAIGVQGYIRAAAPPDEQGRRKVVPRRWSPGRADLAGVDVACLSDEDLIGQGDLLERLRDVVPIVALTHERKGCDILEGGRKTWVGIHPAREVDPTGAGDCFAAGFLFGLARDQSPAEAARLGAACASIIIEGVAGESFERMPEAFERAQRIGEKRP
jgi:sugar/nucleoside kinase (ribokinase family)